MNIPAFKLKVEASDAMLSKHAVDVRGDDVPAEKEGVAGIGLTLAAFTMAADVLEVELHAQREQQRRLQ